MAIQLHYLLHALYRPAEDAIDFLGQYKVLEISKVDR